MKSKDNFFKKSLGQWFVNSFQILTSFLAEMTISLHLMEC